MICIANSFVRWYYDEFAARAIIARPRASRRLRPAQLKAPPSLSASAQSEPDIPDGANAPRRPNTPSNLSTIPSR